jgi:hypothetical protein
MVYITNYINNINILMIYNSIVVCFVENLMKKIASMYLQEEY